MCQKSLTFFPHSTRIGQHLMQNSVAAAGLLPPPSPLFRFSIAGSPPFPFSTCQEPSALFSSRFCLPLCLLFHRDSSVLYTGSTHVSKNIFFCHVFKKSCINVFAVINPWLLQWVFLLFLGTNKIMNIWIEEAIKRCIFVKYRQILLQTFWAHSVLVSSSSIWVTHSPNSLFGIEEEDQGFLLNNAQKSVFHPSVRESLER